MISQAFCVLYYDKVRLNVPIEIVIVPGILYGFISTVYLLLILNNNNTNFFFFLFFIEIHNKLLYTYIHTYIHTYPDTLRHTSYESYDDEISPS